MGSLNLFNINLRLVKYYSLSNKYLANLDEVCSHSDEDGELCYDRR